MEVGPPDPAFLVGKGMGGSEVEPHAPRLIIQLNTDHIKVEEVSEHDVLKGLIEITGPLVLVHVVSHFLGLAGLPRVGRPGSREFSLIVLVLILLPPIGCTVEATFHRSC